MLNWMNLDNISFNSLLLLERVQLSWLEKSNISDKDLGIALRYNPTVHWYIVNKCPEISDFIKETIKSVEHISITNQDMVRESELRVLNAISDWIVYVVNPKIYDEQPFLNWDNSILTDVADFNNKIVVDVGAGTGRLALVAAQDAKAVYAVEPVTRLRDYLKEKAKDLNYNNVYVVDGLIEAIPFDDEFADVIIAGHVVGDCIEKEVAELKRILKPKGQIVLCPGNEDKDNDVHEYLLSQGFEWSRFNQPRDGMKRRYWLHI